MKMKYEITNKKTNKKEIINADNIKYGLSIITITDNKKKTILKRNTYKIREM